MDAKEKSIDAVHTFAEEMMNDNAIRRERLLLLLFIQVKT